MGADFLFSIVPACKITPKRLAELTEMVNAEFKDYDENDSGYSMADVMEALNVYAGGGFDSTREVGVVWIRGAAYYATGGMSWGDGPTEAFDTMCRLDMFFAKMEEWSLEDGEKARLGDKVKK